MSKSESIQLKGVAILVMIWLHTFFTPTGEGYSPLFYVGGESLAYKIGKITTICISLYAFLGGYGMYITYQNSPQMKNWRRVLLLYLNYWLVFIVFIGLGCMLSPDQYPGSIKDMFLNLTGISTTYCAEWWFLFPYTVLILCSRWIIIAIKRFHWLFVIAVTGVGYLTANLLLHFYSKIYDYPLLADGLLTISLLFSFGLGILWAMYDVRLCMKILPPPDISKGLYGNASAPVYSEKKHDFRGMLRISVIIFMLLALIVVRMLIPTGILNPVFMLLFVIIVYTLIKSTGENLILDYLGKQSTKMWLIHPFFCYYLFADFVYSFKYAPLIFIVMVIVSYLSAALLDTVYKPLKKMIIYKMS